MCDRVRGQSLHIWEGIQTQTDHMYDLFECLLRKRQHDLKILNNRNV